MTHQQTKNPYVLQENGENIDVYELVPQVGSFEDVKGEKDMEYFSYPPSALPPALRRKMERCKTKADLEKVQGELNQWLDAHPEYRVSNPLEPEEKGEGIPYEYPFSALPRSLRRKIKKRNKTKADEEQINFELNQWCLQHPEYRVEPEEPKEEGTEKQKE